jgi:hypothetical protein
MPDRREFLQSMTLAGAAPRFRASDRTAAPSVWPSVLSVTDGGDKVVVETTGARFVVYRAASARIEIVQKINSPRELCRMELDTSFADLTVNYHDAEECILYVPVGDFGFNLRIYGDSLFSLRAGRDVRCHTTGNWTPEYNYAEAGNLLFLDRLGGLGQYALAAAHPWGGPIAEPDFGVSQGSARWDTYVRLPVNRTLLTSVAPPRPFDFSSSVNDRIVHHFIENRRTDGTWNYYPADATLHEYARHGNVLILHIWQRGAGPYQGDQVASREDMAAKAAPWATRYNVPLDEREFRRVIATAHREGMRVLPYLSPISFPGTPQQFLDELKRLQETYGLDGFYFDGSPAGILDAYEVMKGTRRLLGPAGLLYVHIPSPILGSSYHSGRYVYCPFVDTYANFILRAEHIDTFDDTVLRYTISGQNISNAIGFVCNYDYSLDFNRRLIQKALEYNVRVPWWGGWDIYLEDLSRGTHKKYPPMSEIHDIMQRDYFPALEKLKQQKGN